MALLKHDDAGFLVGDKVGDDLVQQHLKGIRSDTSRILSLMQKAGSPSRLAAAVAKATGSKRGAEPSFRPRQRDAAGRFTRGDDASPARATSTDKAKSADILVTQAKATAAAAGRLSAVAEASRRDAKFDSKSQKRGADGRFGAGGGSLAGAVASVAGNLRAASTSGAAQIDPIVGALGEVNGVVSRVASIAAPLGRVLPGLPNGKANDRSDRVLVRLWRGFQARWKREDANQRSVLSTLKDIDSKSGKTGGESGGLLPGLLAMIPGVGSLVAGLSSAGAAIGGAVATLRGLLSGAGGGVATAAKSLLSRLPVIGPMVAAALALGTDAALAADESLSPEERQKRRIENAGSTAGSLAGAVAGGAIGTAVLPGIGTVIGAVLGSIAGSGAGRLIGDAINENLGQIKANWDKAVSGLEKAFGAVGEWISSIPGAKTVKDAATTAIDTGAKIVKEAPQAAVGLAGKAAEGAKALGEKALGWVSSFFESGGRGAAAVSTGKGDRGGASYGTYQLASKTGTLQKFLDSSGYAGQFSGLAPGSTEFNSKWKELASDKKFGEAQHDFIKRTHFDPQMAKLGKSGIDLSGRGRAVQEAVWSTSVQFGGGTSLIAKALAGKNAEKMTDAEIVSAIQDYKLANNETLFSKSSADVRAGTLKRAASERKALIAVAAGGASPVAPAVPQAVAAAAPPAIHKIPPASPVPTPDQIQAPRGRDSVKVVQAPSPPRQDVPDRGIAHIASGGISGSMR